MIVSYLFYVTLLLLLGFSIYTYVYFKSYITYDLKKEECVPITNRVTGYCQVWDESDKKCYATVNCDDFSARVVRGKLENWQVGVLAGLAVLCFTFLILYIKSF